MLWMFYALLVTLFSSARAVLRKKTVNHLDEYVISFAGNFFALPFLLAFLLFIEIPLLGVGFLPALIVSGLLRTISIVVTVKALKHSDLSLLAPFYALTPIFIVLVSPFLVGELPTLFGLLGILLTTIGIYVFKIKESQRGLLEPLKAILREKGVKYAALGSFIFSIAINFDKIGLQNSSPLFWVISMNSFVVITLFILMLVKSPHGLHQIPKNIPKLVPLGICGASMLIFNTLAISMTLISYVSSFTRLSILWHVLSGHYVFKEKGVQERLLGALIVISGAVFILWA